MLTKILNQKVYQDVNLKMEILLMDQLMLIANYQFAMVLTEALMLELVENQQVFYKLIKNGYQ
jgi:hypothetical protein